MVYELMVQQVTAGRPSFFHLSCNIQGSSTRLYPMSSSFYNYGNNLGKKNVPRAIFHFFMLMTLSYIVLSIVQSAFEKLQAAFNVVQSNLGDIKLDLNDDKSKVMLFSNTKTMPKPLLLPIITFQGFQIKLLSQYKYLDFILDDFWPLFPTFKGWLKKKVVAKIGFLVMN